MNLLENSFCIVSEIRIRTLINVLIRALLIHEKGSVYNTRLWMFCLRRKCLLSFMSVNNKRFLVRVSAKGIKL